MVRGGVTYRIVSDERDSPRLVVNTSTGEIAQELDYDSYGRITKDTSPGFQPFGFAGGLYDSDTGLTHFGAREYDAETGRFVSQDPLDFSGGDTNLYAYAWGDPVNVVDPEGFGGLSIGGITSRLSHFGRSALNYDVAFSDEITGGGVMAVLMLTGGLDQIDICSGAFKQGGRSGFMAAFFVPGSKVGTGVKAARVSRVIGKVRVPGKTHFLGKNAPRKAADHLRDYHGIDPQITGNRLHRIKKAGGMGATDDVIIGSTGDVYDARTGDYLGSLTDSAWGK